MTMFALDFIVEPCVDACRSVATDRVLMNAVRRRERPGVLRVCGLAGEVVSLGRYHLAPESAEDHGVRLCRRLTGGRVWPQGEGFVGVSLILPHRSAMLGDEPLALRPEQVMNRCVRGVLQAYRALGLDVVYPGRDLFTLNRRALGAMSVETDRAGTLLFEAVLCNARDFGELPGRLARIGDGALLAAEWKADTTVGLDRLLTGEVGVAELAELIRRGYREQSIAEITMAELSGSETTEVEALAVAQGGEYGWVGVRCRRLDLDWRAWSWAQMGVFEAYMRVSDDRRIEAVVLAGDFLANSPAIEALESELQGCPLQEAEIGRVVQRVFRRPGNFLLGLGPLDAIARTLVTASAQ